jgi:hypothetical protein
VLYSAILVLEVKEGKEMKEKRFESTVNYAGMKIEVGGTVDESGVAKIEKIYSVDCGSKPLGATATIVMTNIKAMLNDEYPDWAEGVEAEEELTAADEESFRAGLTTSSWWKGFRSREAI